MGSWAREGEAPSLPRAQRGRECRGVRETVACVIVGNPEPAVLSELEANAPLLPHF